MQVFDNVAKIVKDDLQSAIWKNSADRWLRPAFLFQLVNFWPDLPLDEYINLKSRVETCMRISVVASTEDEA